MLTKQEIDVLASIINRAPMTPGEVMAANAIFAKLTDACKKETDGASSVPKLQ